jgi:beta-glucosidase
MTSKAPIIASLAILAFTGCASTKKETFSALNTEVRSESEFRTPSSTVDFRNDPNMKWCVATAAHQIEGYTSSSDHAVWENGAVDRVITKIVTPNPQADELMKNMAGAFAPEPIPCPDYDSTNDPDPERLNSKIFVDKKTGVKKICEVSGRSINFWARIQDPKLMDEEVQLIKNLNVTEYRFSVEWSRVQPTASTFDEKALQVYKSLILKLREQGIESQVTLFHFTMPQWLRAMGGWENPKSPAYFSNFTKKVYGALGPLVTTWYTFNEPMVHLTAGYAAGVLPPGEKNPNKLPKLLANLLRAHAVSYKALHHLAKKDKHKIRVGMAHHLRIFDPATLEKTSIFDPGKVLVKEIETLGAGIASEAWNWLIFDAVETGKLVLDLKWAAPIIKRLGLKLPDYLNMQPQTIQYLKGTQDFLGINYYTRDLIKFFPEKMLSGKMNDLSQVMAPIVNPEAVKTGNINDMKWEIYPEGFYRILKELNERGLRFARKEAPGGQLSVAHPVREIIVSETGIADADDTRRLNFLKDHLVQMKKAMDEGVPIHGFCYWTLVDNFEWNSGYYPKFGLYTVDLFSKDQKRTLRPSGEWFSKMIKEQGF